MWSDRRRTTDAEQSRDVSGSTDVDAPRSLAALQFRAIPGSKYESRSTRFTRQSHVPSVPSSQETKVVVSI